MTAPNIYTYYILERLVREHGEQLEDLDPAALAAATAAAAASAATALGYRDATIAAAASGTRLRLASNKELYVDEVNGDDGDTGESIILPKATMQSAYDRAADTYDGYKKVIHINVDPGTYVENLVCKSRGAGDSLIQFEPTSTVAEAVVLHPASGVAFDASEGALVDIVAENGAFYIIADGAGGIGIQAEEKSRLRFAGVRLGACTVNHTYATRYGFLEPNGDWEVKGVSDKLIDGTHSGTFRWNTGICTFLADLNFADAVINTNLGEMTMSGSADFDLNGHTITGYKARLLGPKAQWAAANWADIPGDKLGLELSGGKFLFVPASDTRNQIGTVSIDMAAVANNDVITFASNTSGAAFVPGQTRLRAGVSGAVGSAEGNISTLWTAAGLTGGQGTVYSGIRRSDGFFIPGTGTYGLRYFIDGSNIFSLKTPSLKMDGSGLELLVEKTGTPTGTLVVQYVMIGRQ